jgi:hypothetical protein
MGSGGRRRNKFFCVKIDLLGNRSLAVIWDALIMFVSLVKYCGFGSHE